MTGAMILLGIAFMVLTALYQASLGASFLVSAATHGLLDRRWPVRAVLRLTRSTKFAETQSPVCGMYTADQALHQLSLLGSSLLVALL